MAYISKSQNSKSSPVENFPVFDTSYIKSYTDQLGLFTYALRKYRTYGLKNKELNTKLKFEPNGQTNLGLGFNYKWINLGVAGSFEFMNKDNHVYGETSRLDLQFNAFSRFIGFSGHYQKYTGFYLSNPDDFLNWDESYYPYLADLESTSFGISVFYFFNHKKFSYKAAYIRNEVQKKSAGGFVLGSYIDVDKLYRPSGFVPEELPDSLNQLFNFNGFTTYVAGISFGYTYTQVFLKRCFINFSLVPGIGYRALSISNGKVPANFTGSINARISLAYEGKRFYCGISSYSSAESFKYESIDISTNSGLLRFYLGKRFQFKKHKKVN